MRIAERMRTKPRVFDKMEESVEEWLVDQVWLVRYEEQEGTDDGTPIEKEVVLGPYAGKLFDPEMTEDRQPDRITREKHHVLKVETDEVPDESWRYHVEKDGTLYVCQMLSTAEPHRAAWGPVVLWHLEVEIYSEY